MELVGLFLILVLSILTLSPSTQCTGLVGLKDEYSESLLLKPHQDGTVAGHFRFKILWSWDHQKSYWNRHYSLFPFAIGSLLTQHEVQELHFSLTNGHWKHRRWGLPVRGSMPGAELWLWFSPFHPKPQSAWKEVSSKLSAQFCTSMNFRDNAVTINPSFSFRPEGPVDENLLKNSSVFYAGLAHESTCTENLTPWKKLLPTFGRSGLASLLSATNLFDSQYISLSIDVKPVCFDQQCSRIHTELVLSLTVVFNPAANGKQSFSLYRLFGSTIQHTSPLSSSTNIYVDISDNVTGVPFELNPLPDSIVDESLRKIAVYDLNKYFETTNESDTQEEQSKQVKPFNLAVKYTKNHLYGHEVLPHTTITRSVTGYGLYSGGILTKITNRNATASRVIYTDIIPWYFRIYTHTLSIVSTKEGGNPVVMHPDSLIYIPSKDRVSPHHLELLFTLPANSITTITIDFDRSFLKWTEYPPDANHGLYGGSGILTLRSNEFADLSHSSNLTLFPGSHSNIIRLYTECLLISLPTPDFSMPYNVICLVSTVISLAFGPIHSLTTRSIKPADSGEGKGAAFSLTRLREYLKKKLLRKHSQGDCKEKNE